MKKIVLIFLLPIILIAQSEPKFLDFHIHNGFSVENNKVILSNFKYFKQRDVNTFSFPLPVDRSKTDDLYQRIKIETEQLKLLSKQTGTFNIADSNELYINPNQINVILSLEYFYGIFDGKLENVKNYKQLGVHSITIYNNEIDKLFDGNNLTLFGKQIINEMNKHQILIDISHISDERKIKIINYSKSPVIVSHTNARKLADLDYNLSDTVLKALKKYKGYVFVSFNENGLYKDENREGDAIDKFTDHIDYLVKLLGIDYVGIGSDYQADGKYIPQALNKVTSFNNISRELLRRNYSKSDVRKIMFKNVVKAISDSF